MGVKAGEGSSTVLGERWLFIVAIPLMWSFSLTLCSVEPPKMEVLLCKLQQHSPVIKKQHDARRLKQNFEQNMESELRRP